MKLTAFLWREYRGKLLLTVLLLFVQAFLNVVLLRVVGSYTSQMHAAPLPWWGFLCLAVTIVCVQAGAMLLTNRMVYATASSIRASLLRAIRGAPLDALEEVGPSRMLTAYVEDVQRITGAMQIVVGLARDLSLVAGILAYLLVLSPLLMGDLAGMLALGVAAFWLLRRQAIKFAVRHRAATDKVYALLGNVLDGIKQLKTDQELEGAVSEALGGQLRQAERAGVQTGLLFTGAIQSALLVYFATFFIFTYVHFNGALDSGVLTTYVLGIVIIFNPLINAAVSSEQVSAARLSLERIGRIAAALAVSQARPLAAQTQVEPARQALQADPTGLRSVQSLELRALCHSYHGRDRQQFSLGPIDVTVRSGECLFIVGGNGTGKTTLLKLITGLYAATGGEVRIDGQPVAAGQRARLGQLFSPVFSDFCLFEAMAGSMFDTELTRRGTPWIRELRLAGAVQEDKSVLSQARSCSSGERKRLALLFARLSDRPVYVFDEFASDQDPDAKSLFYDHVLVELRRNGKIVIVVTHDDRYFDRADRLLILERGLPPRVVENIASGPQASSTENSYPSEPCVTA